MTERQLQLRLAQAVQARMIRNCRPFWQNVSGGGCPVWTVFMGYTNPCAMYCLVLTAGRMAQWCGGTCLN